MSRSIVNFLPAKTDCKWHNQYEDSGYSYSLEEMIPEGFCPIMFHTLYPYFLGAIFGAKYTYNEQGDCHVCCPAKHSVDVLVKVRDNDGSFGEDVVAGWRNVFFAEVVKVNGPCDFEYCVGDKLIFPISNRKRYMCSASVNSMFPFLNIDIPNCIDLDKIRCPDWKESVYYSLGEKDDEK